MIIYTNLMPRRFDGMTIGPLTLIRPCCKDDVALHVHEAIHREQFARHPLRSMLYIFSKDVRTMMEVEAYRAQIHAGADPRLCAFSLATKYGLGITQDCALLLLTQPA